MTFWPNWVDLIVVIILLTSCYNGFSVGIFTGTLRCMGLVLVTLVTVNFSSVATNWIQSWIRLQPVLTAFLAFWLIFFTLVLVIRIVINAIARVIKWEPVNLLTQWLGLLLGGVRGVWWAGLFLLALSVSGVIPFQESIEQRSMSTPYLLPVFHECLEDLSDRFPGAGNRYPTLFPPVR